MRQTFADRQSFVRVRLGLKKQKNISDASSWKIHLFYFPSNSAAKSSETNPVTNLELYTPNFSPDQKHGSSRGF